MEDDLRILAHDIRTPLTALKVAIGLLGVRLAAKHVDELDLLGSLRFNTDRLVAVAEELTALTERRVSRRGQMAPSRSRGLLSGRRDALARPEVRK